MHENTKEGTGGEHWIPAERFALRESEMVFRNKNKEVGWITWVGGVARGMKTCKRNRRKYEIRCPRRGGVLGGAQRRYSQRRETCARQNRGPEADGVLLITPSWGTRKRLKLSG